MRIIFPNLFLKLFCSMVFVVLCVAKADAADQQTVSESVQTSKESQVIQAFTSKEDIESEIIKVDDQRKRQVMFAMGVPLLLFILITVVLGIAMGVFGKDVYIPHMIFAGLSLTLALGHAVVGMVWFWPF